MAKRDHGLTEEVTRRGWHEGGVTKSRGQQPPTMFGKGGPRPKAQAKTPVLLTGMTSVTRVPVFAAVKTERREGSG